MQIQSSPMLTTALRSRSLLAALALILTFSVVPHAYAAPCPQSATDPSVTICTPANGATVSSPVPIVAGTNSSSAVSYMQIYVDGVKKYEILNASQLSTSVAMDAGARRVTVQAKNAAGVIFKQTISITVGPSSGGGGGTVSGLSNIKHIFFMLQENRSFDSYFGKLGEYRSNLGLGGTFDGLPAGAKGLTKTGQYVPAFHQQTVCTENMSPGWNESHFDLDGGKMDRFPYTNAGSIPSTIDPQGTRSMGYYDWNDLPYYYDLATQFATSDRFFSSVLAPTIPNRMYMFTGTSFGHIRPDAKPTGGWTQKTIFQLMDEAGVSWRYYYQDNSVFLADFSIWGKDQGKVYNISKYYTDIQSPNTLPSVIFIERAGQTGLDEHPLNNVQKGAASVRNIITKLQESPTWGSSVFIWTFDEGGGLYDHVIPATVPKPDAIAPMLRSTDIKADFNQTGFRVPFIFVSPWVKPHYVSHTVMEFGSILKLIETRFMPGKSLTARDANAPDMTEFFDFTTPHWLTPPVAKFQQTDGLCSHSAEKAPGW